MPKRVTDFRDELLADLVDPVEAARYLNAALEDSDRMALVALRDVADARQMSRVAEDAGVAREALYRMLCQTGNPTYANFLGILDAVGLKIEFAPVSGDDVPREPVASGSNSPESDEERAVCHGAAPQVRDGRRWKIRGSPRRRGKRASATRKTNSWAVQRTVTAKGIGASAPRTLAIAS